MTSVTELLKEFKYDLKSMDIQGMSDSPDYKNLEWFTTKLERAIKADEQSNRYAEQEMKEFNSHLNIQSYTL